MRVQVWRDKALKKSKLKVKCTLFHLKFLDHVIQVLEDAFEYQNEYNRPVAVGKGTRQFT
jgi:hypothetical protein